jgi:uncharacterized protein YndB with AHSA1/START domain
VVPNSIEREVLIDAPVELVWSIVTEPEYVGRWLSDTAQIDRRPGGEAIFTWEAYGTTLARVERVEPPHLLALRWMDPGRQGEIREGTSTLVELHLRADGEGTRLRVVESGFAELDGSEAGNATNAEKHGSGWDVHLGDLLAYVSRERLSPRS